MARISKYNLDDIVDAGFECIKEGGKQNLTARTVGKKLGASSMIVFTHFKNVDDLYDAVYKKAYKFYIDYMLAADYKDYRYKYKTGALRYIEFAKEYKNLFEMLFMSKRDFDFEHPEEERLGFLYSDIQEETGLSHEAMLDIAYKFWIFVHGLTVLLITTYMPFDQKYIEQAITQNFENLVNCHLAKKKYM